MKIFLDTSVLIEYIKGNKTELFENIVSEDNNLYINSIVYSEFIFHFLSAVSGNSPFTLKKNKKIKRILETYNPIEFIQQFEVLPENKEIIESSYHLIKEYNLLPNDSLIIATCKHYNIENIATYDSDFEKVLSDLKINLLRWP